MSAAAREQTAQIVHAAAEGDESAFEELVRRFGPRMRALALRLGGDAALADDSVQDAFVRLHAELDSIREPDALGAWLARVVRNRCLDALRARTRRGAIEGIDASAHVDVVDSADEHAMRRQRREALRAALDGLPDELRETLALRFDAELSYSEISELLDCPVGSVGSRIHRALGHLARSLASTPHDWEVP